MTDTRLYVIRVTISRDGIVKRFPMETILGKSAEQVAVVEALDWSEMLGLEVGPVIVDGDGRTICLVTGDEESPVVEVRVA